MFFTCAVIRTTAMGQNQTVDLVLPTDNDALFSGGGAAFYQHIDRNFKGVKINSVGRGTIRFCP